MEHVDVCLRRGSRKADQCPAGIRRRVCTLGDAFELQRDGIGSAAERNELWRILQRKQRRHEPFDVAADARCGRAERPAVNPDSQLISICRRRTGRFARVHTSRMRASTLPLMARLLRITSSTPYCCIVCSRLSIVPRTGTPTIHR